MKKVVEHCSSATNMPIFFCCFCEIVKDYNKWYDACVQHMPTWKNGHKMRL
uniref:Uncharacterized protein n=1 Tax=Octopus bimaculoides TaxID=37653 RepID=A0A0L8GDR3_OCTBM